MKQEQFEQRFSERWDKFEQWVAREQLMRSQRKNSSLSFDETEVPARYREVCQQLAIARSRDYSLSLVERLHRLALDGHDLVYGTPGGWARSWLQWLMGGFARDVRRHWRSVLVACVLFYGSYLAMMIAVRLWPEFAYTILPEQMLSKFDQMYGPGADALGRARDAGDDMTMFGFYISNNIGISFRTFAGGLFAGLGALFALAYNGMLFGVVEAHVVNLGYAQHFYSFVAGHSSFELTAIMLCGAAGLDLGWALLAPGGFSRGAALRAAARDSIGIVSGAAIMLLIAAGIEAFWSPRELLPMIKYGVGIFNWLLVTAYFVLAGRNLEPR